MFDPSKFTLAKARPLPIYLLLDVSGSMDGAKINTLNSAVQTMLEAFAKEERMETLIAVGIVTFGGDKSELFLPLTPAKDITWTPLVADGYTPMGDALRMVKSLVEDRNVIPSNAYRPTLILVSDGQPNDDWEDAMNALIGQGRSAKCDRMSMAIGSDADSDVLTRFLKDTPHKLFTAKDSDQLHRFFRKLTMSIQNRSRSQNPNDLPSDPDIQLDEAQEPGTAAPQPLHSLENIVF